MRDSAALKLALVLTLCGMAVSCRSLSSPPRPADGGLVADRFALEGFDWVMPPPLPPDAFAGAEAPSSAPLFALYATGLHYELAEANEAAGSFYARAAELDPASEVLLRRRAYTATQAGGIEEAARLMEEHYAAYPESETALSWLIHFYITTHETNRVRTLAQRAVKHFPKDPASWIRLAVVEEQMGADFDAVAQPLRDGILKSTNAAPLRRLFVQLAYPRLAQPGDADPKLLQEVLKNFRALQKEDAEDLPMQLRHAELLVRDGRVLDAAEVLKRIEQANPYDMELRIRAAAIFALHRTVPEAIALLEETLQRNPRKSDSLHAYLAILQRDHGDLPAAREQLRLAVAADPQDTLSWLYLVSMIDYPEAVRLLDDAIAATPDDARPYQALAYLHTHEGHYTAADQAFQLAAARFSPAQPDAGAFYLNYALNTTHLNRPEDAAGWLYKAIQEDPDNLTRYFAAILAADSPTLPENGIATLDILLTLPLAGQDLIHTGKGLLLAFIGDFPQAVDAFTQAEQFAQENPALGTVLNYDNFHFWFAVSLDTDGRTEDAIAHLQRAIAINPNHADALNHLAYTWALLGEHLDTALEYSTRSLALDPGNGAYLDTLGWIHYQLGNYEEALRLIEAADSLRPGEEDITQHLEAVRQKLHEQSPAPTE